jgi:7,8-dihydropterin-6-yl-methyl-4-(beta-D-ribofuranosyl)aminobenzene 5'-phosphate synthase
MQKHKPMKTIFVWLATVVCFGLSAQENKPSKLTNQEESALYKAMENDSVFASWVGDTARAVELYERYKLNVTESDSTWNSDQQRIQKIEDFGYTTRFELIPLVENLSGNAAFKKAGGVSYLIRTDSSTILFDTGIDDDTLQCAFRYNLDILGIDISEIDVVFISHNHGDHQNEWKWINDRSFVNRKNENILPGLKIFVPEDNLNLTLATTCSPDPVKISEGVYTTGIIKAPLFFYPTQEQGLVFNVKNRGIVILTGCGHQTIDKLLQRCGSLSDLPVYGILGGMHFPVRGDSERYMGYFITDFLPWETFTVADVNKKADMLQKRNIKLIGISTHDSSPVAIEALKEAFSREYIDMRTGEWITIK